MRLDVFAWTLAVVGVCYIVLSMPFVSAVNIRVFWGGAQYASADYNPWSLVDVSFSEECVGNPTPYCQDYALAVSVKNSTPDVAVNSVYIYQCGNKGPEECMKLSPLEYGGDASKSFLWSATSSGGVSRFLVAARAVKDGGVFWVGRFVEYRRDSPAEPVYHNSYDLDNVDVYVKDYSQIGGVADAIAQRFMVPFDANVVEKVVLQGAEYVIEAVFYPDRSSEAGKGDAVSSVSGDYGVLFSNYSGGVYNGIAFFRESGGSSQGCDCLSGQYCDAVYGCRNENLISLEVYGSPGLHVTNCFERHEIYVPVEVKNPPGDMVIEGYRYSLGGEERSAACSVLYGNVYNCTIVVEPLEGCTSGTQTIGPNNISFDISYTDDGTLKTKTLSVDIPDVVIGSYTCGNGVFEKDLGESSENCCYDAGCPDGYCDVDGPGNPESGQCRQEFGNSNMVASIEKTRFDYFSVQGRSVGVSVEFLEPPSSLSVGSWSCDAECESGGEACDASCSISCPESEPFECTMDVSIGDYDENREYVLRPEISVSAEYYNASEMVRKTLSASAGALSISANWCGDRICQSDESSESCCYDCGCGEGFFCDSGSEGASSSDMCRELDSVDVIIDSMSSAEFGDAAERNVINITARVPDAPKGLSVEPYCSIGDGNVTCDFYCDGRNVSGDYVMNCTLEVGPVRYTDPEVYGFYDAGTHRMTVTGNVVGFEMEFNSGPDIEWKTTEKDIGDITMDVVWHCGMDVWGDGNWCEADLGENSENCCIDCGCGDDIAPDGNPKMFCYTGDDANGACLERESIEAEIAEVNPDVVSCQIPSVTEAANPQACRIPRSIEVKVSVSNPPEGFDIEGAYWKVPGEECMSGREECPANCRPYIGERGEEEGNYTCSVVLPVLENPSPGEYEKNIVLNLSGSYGIKGKNHETVGTATEEFLLEGKIVFNVTKSVALKSCEEQQESLDKAIGKLERIKSALEAFLMVVWGIVAVLWAKYFVCCAECNVACAGCCATPYSWAKTGTLIGICLSGTILGVLSSVKSKLEGLRADRYSLMCTAEDAEGIKRSQERAGGTWESTVGMVMQVVCIILSLGGGLGGGSSTSESNIVLKSQQTSQTRPYFTGLPQLQSKDFAASNP